MREAFDLAGQEGTVLLVTKLLNMQELGSKFSDWRSFDGMMAYSAEQVWRK